MRTILITLLIMLAAPISAQDFQKGYEAAQSGDFETALKEWKPLAEGGNIVAQHNLGMMYRNGWGVSRDGNEAVRWYKLSAKQGYADAQFNLGVIYHEGKAVPQDYIEAAKWYRLAAEQGFLIAPYNLGLMYGVIGGYLGIIERPQSGTS